MMSAVGGARARRVVGVSLGSSRRDHQATLVLDGVQVSIQRRGTDGDLERARERLTELDGQVDAIGLGGIDRWLVVDGARYTVRDAQWLVANVKTTPVVDGRGLKECFEPRVIRDLLAQGQIDPSQRVLMVSALDRFGMAESFYALGFPTVAGDLIFGVGLDMPILSRRELVDLARRLLPQVVNRPFTELYPVGEAQNRDPDPRYERYFDEAEIIAGDFHLIRKYLPPTLAGKVVVTNTTTADDVEQLRRRGVRLLVTTTPVLEGRSFGTNVVEAAVVAVTGVTPEDSRWQPTVDGLKIEFGQLNLNPVQ